MVKIKSIWNHHPVFFVDPLRICWENSSHRGAAVVVCSQLCLLSGKSFAVSSWSLKGRWPVGNIRRPWGKEDVCFGKDRVKMMPCWRRYRTLLESLHIHYVCCRLHVYFGAGIDFIFHRRHDGYCVDVNTASYTCRKGILDHRTVEMSHAVCSIYQSHWWSVSITNIRWCHEHICTLHVYR